MDDITIWIIIIAFYAPLHYMLPVLILFITGTESDAVRKTLIRRALIDSTLSMVLAFILIILLVGSGFIGWAMLVMLLSMPLPFIRIIQHCKEITH
ncbi:MAG: hypothetical protein QNJ69_02200 [Gammaproteobacteria bacterium]|nr:hypothetical protein [Gammaproteobacteria bacterium]